MQERQRPLVRQVPPPFEAVPQLRGHGAGVCGAAVVSALVGDGDGSGVVGASVGCGLGAEDRNRVGSSVGARDGARLGRMLGEAVG